MRVGYIRIRCYFSVALLYKTNQIGYTQGNPQTTGWGGGGPLRYV